MGLKKANKLKTDYPLNLKLWLIFFHHYLSKIAKKKSFRYKWLNVTLSNNELISEMQRILMILK